MLGYFASNNAAYFWNSGTSIDASSTVIVTLAVPTAVLDGVAVLVLPPVELPGAQAARRVAHATDTPATAVTVVRRRERVEVRSMTVSFGFVGRTSK